MEEKQEKQEQKECHKWLMQICPICGKEFACNKTHHVYMERVGRKRLYYCSYSCLLYTSPSPRDCS